MPTSCKKRAETIYTAQKDLGNTSGACCVAVEPGIFEYKATPAGNTDFSFNFDNCDTGMIISFFAAAQPKRRKLHYSYTFPETSSFQWLDGLSASPSGSYLMTFRRYPPTAAFWGLPTGDSVMTLMGKINPLGGAVCAYTPGTILFDGSNGDSATLQMKKGFYFIRGQGAGAGGGNCGLLRNRRRRRFRCRF